MVLVNCRMLPQRWTGCRLPSLTVRRAGLSAFSFGTWIAMQLLMRRPEIDRLRVRRTSWRTSMIIRSWRRVLHRAYS